MNSIPLHQKGRFSAKQTGGSADLCGGQIYLLLGPEEYLKEKALTQLEESLVSPSERMMNRDVFWGETVVPETLEQALETLPWMSKRRIVILRRCEDLEVGNVSVIKRWFAKGASSTTLILLSREKKLGRELMEAVEARGHVLPFKERSFEEASRWIQEYVQTRGKRLSADAAHFIVGEAGEDLMRLAGEMDKLCLAFVNPPQSPFAKGGGDAESPEISLETAQRVLGHLHTSRLSALAEASILGQPVCVEKFQEALEAREEPVRIVTYILWQMRRFLRARLLQEEGASQGEIISTCGVFFKEAPKFLKQLANIRRSQLIENMRMLLWADEALKTSLMPVGMVLSLLGLGFCRGEKHLELARPS